MLSAVGSEEEDGARRVSLSLLCCFIHKAALSFLFFMKNSVCCGLILTSCLSPGQWSCPILSQPWRNTVLAWRVSCQGFGRVTHGPAGIQPGLPFPGLWVHSSNQSPCYWLARSASGFFCTTGLCQDPLREQPGWGLGQYPRVNASSSLHLLLLLHLVLRPSSHFHNRGKNNQANGFQV